MTQMEGALHAGVGASGRGSTSSGRPGISPRNDWVPRLIHTQGFADYGCESTAKLRKLEVAKVQKRLLAICPPAIQQRVEVMPGFTLNHKRVLEGEDRLRYCRSLADGIDVVTRQKDFCIHGKNARTVPEPQIARRRQYSRWCHAYRALGSFRKVGVDFESCARSTSVYVLLTWILLGKVMASDEGEINIQWAAVELEKLGLHKNIAGGLEET